MPAAQQAKMSRRLKLNDRTDSKEKLMAGNHDEHDGPIHQATWVPGMTVAICLGFVAIIATVKILFGA